MEPEVKLNPLQKLRLFIFGYTPTTRRKRAGWSRAIQFYAFKCPIHGIVEDYPHGYSQVLRCHKCANNTEP